MKQQQRMKWIKTPKRGEDDVEEIVEGEMGRL